MFLKSLRQAAAWAALATTVAFPTYALDKVEGKEYQSGAYQHGTWPYTILSASCEKPHYLLSGLLQGVWYTEGWYCANLSVLYVRHYTPRVMLGTSPWNVWAP